MLEAGRSGDERAEPVKVENTVSKLNLFEKRKSEEYEMNGRREEACSKSNGAERGEPNEVAIADCHVRDFSFEGKGFEGGEEGRQDAIKVDGRREASVNAEEVEMEYGRTDLEDLGNHWLVDSDSSHLQSSDSRESERLIDANMISLRAIPIDEAELRQRRVVLCSSEVVQIHDGFGLLLLN
jgi:hypothetical protein